MTSSRDLVIKNSLTKEKIENAPVINHTDKELIMLEKLVGRIPPFAKPGQPKKKIYGILHG